MARKRFTAEQIIMKPREAQGWPLEWTSKGPRSSLDSGATHDLPPQSTAKVEMMCVERENNEGQEGFQHFARKECICGVTPLPFSPAFRESFFTCKALTHRISKP